jgi:S1-C subfamily serine protease
MIGGFTMGEYLLDLSDALAKVVETAGRSVVRVEARRRLPASGIVWSADGIIVTAHHTVEKDRDISVGLHEGGTTSARLVGRDPTTDLAVLSVKTKGLTPAKVAAPDDLRVGHLALALGRPGRTVQATLGIVSALGDAWRTSAGGQLDRYLQTDVVMYPGFSGGPLVDGAGQVRGLNTSGMLRGISLAVPVPTLRRVIDTLLTHGRVRRGYLGVGAQPVRLPTAVAQQASQETGLLLVSVNPGSPADKAGLLLGDTIIHLDDHSVRSMDDLLLLLSGDRVGATVPVSIVRGGQVVELTVVIGERE